jgi:excisionase family DNA binding protein
MRDNARRDEILTLEELAEYLKVSPWTIYRFVRERNLPSYKIGGQWRFRKEQVDAWIDRSGRNVSAGSEE